ncbi:MAG: beta-lactamase family protein [Planctomycetes bacterium]|nr:beta-lactamase family protein [Planctomycetota bacterium]
MPCHSIRKLVTFSMLFVFASRAAATFAYEPSLAEQLAKYVEGGKISGAVTLVANRDGVLDVQAVGKADLDSNTAMRDTALFGIASMTKPITAAALMILVDEGKVRLDDPVSKHIPAFGESKLKSGEAPKELMTVRHLLTHTSGLGGSQQNEGTLAETADELARRPLDFEPGTRWQYSPGLTVCGRIIEVAGGTPYDRFLSQRIFEPLGMKDTTFQPSEEQRSRIARLYEPGKTPGTLAPVRHWITDFEADRTPNPSAGLFSTAADLARFHRAILRGGELDGVRVLSDASVRDMTRIQTGTLTTGFTSGNGWGYGWCVVREPAGVTGMLRPGTFGHGGAFGTQVWIDPDQDLVFVLLIQRAKFGNGDDSEIRRGFQTWAVERFGR